MDAKQTPLVDLLRLHADDLHSDYGHNRSSRLLSQAADEIDRLKLNLVALEDEKNTYIDYVGDALGQDHDGETLWDAAQRVLSERDRLRAELEECRRDAERLDSLEQMQQGVHPVTERVRVPTTTTEQRYVDEWRFIGWSVSGRLDELPTIRDAIDALAAKEE